MFKSGWHRITSSHRKSRKIGVKITHPADFVSSMGTISPLCAKLPRVRKFKNFDNQTIFKPDLKHEGNLRSATG